MTNIQQYPKKANHIDILINEIPNIPIVLDFDQSGNSAKYENDYFTIDFGSWFMSFSVCIYDYECTNTDITNIEVAYEGDELTLTASDIDRIINEIQNSIIITA